MRSMLEGQVRSARARIEDAHLHELAEWLFAVVMKRAPWTSWTDDIYWAMRCIDHLPIG